MKNQNALIFPSSSSICMQESSKEKSRRKVWKSKTKSGGAKQSQGVRRNGQLARHTEEARRTRRDHPVQNYIGAAHWASRAAHIDRGLKTSRNC